MSEVRELITAARERVRTTLDHRQPDRIPVDFGGTAVTGMHVSIVAALREHYALEPRLVKVHEPYQMLGMIDDDLKEALGIDVEGLSGRETMFGFRNDDWRPWMTPFGLEVLVADQFHTTTDDRGDTYIYPMGNTSVAPSGRMPSSGFFFDTIIRQEPFDSARLDPADNLEEYHVVSDAYLDDLETDVSAVESTGRALIATLPGMALGDIAFVPAPGLERPRGIRDITEWYVSIRKRPDYIRQVFTAQVDVALENLARIHRRVGERLDAVMTCGTDFGTQTGAFCSVDTFQNLWSPHYRRVNDWIHDHTTWKTFKHSCGSVERFMRSFIECGFDIINPVQCSAANMEAEHLKREYGRDLVFWGGGVDTQHTLPFGTPGEVREQVLRRCEVFGAGGGFVFNSIHNVQAGTPLENVVAMIDAVHEYNGRG
jgi:Uroporphyrinogen decarboxylase (URO-D)